MPCCHERRHAECSTGLLAGTRTLCRPPCGSAFCRVRRVHGPGRLRSGCLLAQQAHIRARFRFGDCSCVVWALVCGIWRFPVERVGFCEMHEVPRGWFGHSSTLQGCSFAPCTNCEEELKFWCLVPRPCSDRSACRETIACSMYKRRAGGKSDASCILEPYCICLNREVIARMALQNGSALQDLEAEHTASKMHLARVLPSSRATLLIWQCRSYTARLHMCSKNGLMIAVVGSELAARYAR